MNMSIDTATPDNIDQAAAALDAHVREIVRYHFSPETGTPFWLDWADHAGWNPAEEVTGLADLSRFDPFQDEWLRNEPHQRWIPKPRTGQPFFVFETGGTTGMPKQRISWDDHRTDYSEFSDTLDDDAFPPGSNWLMLGPTGPRRLRLAIEHLANVRGGSCYHVDLDPRWVKRLVDDKEFDLANRYKEYVIDQAVMILKHREVACLFATPKLLEALGERLNVPDAGIRGVFCGGTSMTPQNVRFLCEEVLENRAQFVPTYGNTLMGLACSRPLTPADRYSITYHAPQPRAVLRVVDPDATDRVVDYDEWGRVELSTLTHEFFMPRFLERDEAQRRRPCSQYPWDGVGDVRPFRSGEQSMAEGVY